MGLIVFFALFTIIAFSQEKEVILNSDMEAEVVEVLYNADEETNKELTEAKGDYVHWFTVSEFIMTYNEESDLYGLQEVELPEADLDEIKWNVEEENDEILK